MPDLLPGTLLAELEDAGRTPSRELLEAAQTHLDALAPALLTWFREESDPDWSEDDPRHFRAVHAGNLLLDARRADALALFFELLDDEDSAEGVMDWHHHVVLGYGLDLVPPLLALVGREEALPEARTWAASTLGHLAAPLQEAPALRQQAESTLLGLLPPLRPDGTSAIEEDVDDDTATLWGFVVLALMDIGSKAEPERVRALLRGDVVVDPMIFGGQYTYETFLRTPYTPTSEPPFDLLRAYHPEPRPENASLPEYDAPEEERTAMKHARFISQVAAFADAPVAERQRLAQAYLDATTDDARARALQRLLNRVDVDALTDEDYAFLRRHLGLPAETAPAPTFVHEAPRAGRNAPCPCGSGKKYKKCCGA